MTDIGKAIVALDSSAQVSINAEDTDQITWHDGNPNNITTAQIQAKQAELMDDFEYELAGDYLAMAAYLAEIKSRILLPREEENEDEESDPKAELIRRLQEYKRCENLRGNRTPRFSLYWT